MFHESIEVSGFNLRCHVLLHRYVHLIDLLVIFLFLCQYFCEVICVCDLVHINVNLLCGTVLHLLELLFFEVLVD